MWSVWYQLDWPGVRAPFPCTFTTFAMAADYAAYLSGVELVGKPHITKRRA